jgi:RNA polymerase sigma-70 factor (ECF subfamily)
MPTPRHAETPAPCPSDLRQRLPGLMPRLKIRARRLCSQESDALDLVQDTAARALAYEARFEPGTNLYAWLERMLVNLFVSRYRRSTRERRALTGLADDPCSWLHADAPPAMATLGPQAAGVLSELSEPFRRVVELVDLSEFSYEDAANTLGVPIGTVMSRLHRARRLLAGKLLDVERRAA